MKESNTGLSFFCLSVATGITALIFCSSAKVFWGPFEHIDEMVGVLYWVMVFIILLWGVVVRPIANYKWIPQNSFFFNPFLGPIIGGCCGLLLSVVTIMPALLMFTNPLYIILPILPGSIGLTLFSTMIRFQNRLLSDDGFIILGLLILALSAALCFAALQ